MYGMTGDYPAPIFFGINSDNGDIFVILDLKKDDLRTLNYLVRILKIKVSGDRNYACYAFLYISIIRFPVFIKG